MENHMTNETAKRLVSELTVKTIGESEEQATEFGVVLISHEVDIYQFWGSHKVSIEIRKKFAKYLREWAEPFVNPPGDIQSNRYSSAVATANDLCLRIVGSGGPVQGRQTTEFGLVMQSHGIQIYKFGHGMANNVFGRFLVSWAEGIEEEWKNE